MGLTEGFYKIIVTRDIGPQVMPLLREQESFNLVICPDTAKPSDRQEWIKENIVGARALLCMLSDKITEDIIEAAGPSLKVISTMSVGYEHVHLPTCSRKGIRVGYTPNILTDAVADTAIMLALMASRNAKEAMATVQEGQWPTCPWTPFGFCGPQLSMLPSLNGEHAPSKTIGFLGFGRIARATLQRLVPFGISTFIYTGNPKSPSLGASQQDNALATSLGLPEGSIVRVSRTELAERADMLFVFTPGGPATHHLVDRAFLARMKPTAVLINPSRGTIVDSDALAEALREKRIWGAGLDVLEGEPDITADHPLVREPRCVILPHIASAATETRIGIGRLSALNLIGGVLGKSMPYELALP